MANKGLMMIDYDYEYQDDSAYDYQYDRTV